MNSLTPLLVGHWSSNNEATQCYNLEGKSASNVILGKDQQELVAVLIDRFSFPGQWVLDSSKSNGKSDTYLKLHTCWRVLDKWIPWILWEFHFAHFRYIFGFCENLVFCNLDNVNVFKEINITSQISFIHFTRSSVTRKKIFLPGLR